MATILAPLSEVTADRFARATEVTYLGTVYGTMAALARMRPRNRGVVVQVGSALSYRAIPLQAAYCGAKFAIRGFTDTVRTELLHERSCVWITMVQLPAVNTPQFEWCETRMPDHPQPVPPRTPPRARVGADAGGLERPRAAAARHDRAARRAARLRHTVRPDEPRRRDARRGDDLCPSAPARAGAICDAVAPVWHRSRATPILCVYHFWRDMRYALGPWVLRDMPGQCERGRSVVCAENNARAGLSLVTHDTGPGVAGIESSDRHDAATGVVGRAFAP
jgi:NAD(P)-dependent dehydrogenase (short-subunit alcohol dehydrogenase family)